MELFFELIFFFLLFLEESLIFTFQKNCSNSQIFILVALNIFLKN